MPPPDSDIARGRAVRRVLWAVLALNLAVTAAKLATGWWTSSIAMVADGFHSLTDSASNVIGLVGIALAARPPDDSHPYGHRKFETLAAFCVGALLAMTSWEILESCIERLVEGGAPRPTGAAFAVMGSAIAVSLGVTVWERRRGRELGSELLAADATHTLTDVYTSLAVVASLVAAGLGLPQLDLLAALAITGAIAYAAFRVLREAASGLADTAVMPAEELRRVALEVPGVESVHKIRTRGRPEAAHADLHVQVDPQLRLDQAHLIGHLVTERLEAELGIRDVLAHVEPTAGHRTDWHPERTEEGDDEPAADEAQGTGATPGGER